MHPKDILRGYETQINAHDFSLITPLIAQDAVFWFNDGSHSGLKAIEAAFQKTWQNFPLEAYWLEDLCWIAMEEKASACVYTFCWKAIVQGKPVTGRGRGTTVLRKDSGDWKIVHEHLSPFPPKPGKG